MKKRLFKGLLTGVALSASIVTLVSCGGSKEAKEYLVSFNSNDPDTSDSIRPTVYNDISVTSGDTIDLSQYQPTYEGYAFDGWYLDDTFTTEFTSTTEVKSNLSLVAKWQDTVTVTFNTNGGSTVNPQTINKGSVLTTPASPTKTSVSSVGNTEYKYTFEGWYTDEALTNKFDLTTVISTDMNLYANYTIELAAKSGYTLAKSSVLLSDYEVASTSALEPFATTDGVFSFSKDSSKNQIRDKNKTWEKTAVDVTGSSTNISLTVNTLNTFEANDSMSFTRSYVLGGKTGAEGTYNSASSINVECATDGYIVVYGLFTEGIGIIDMSNHEIIETKDAKIVDSTSQFVYNVKAGSYKIYRTGGTGEVFYLEYFSATQAA